MHFFGYILIRSVCLAQFAELGVDGSILLLQACLDQMNFPWKDHNDVQVEPVIGLIFRYLLGKPNFATVFCQSLKDAEITEGLLQIVSNALRLSLPEKVALGLVLSDSENYEIKMCGEWHSFCICSFVCCIG